MTRDLTDRKSDSAPRQDGHEQNPLPRSRNVQMSERAYPPRARAKGVWCRRSESWSRTLTCRSCADSRGSPQRWAHRLGVLGEHDVETDADARLRTLVRADGVVKVGREKEERSVPDLHDDQIGVLGAELGDWRSDDAGLWTRIVKVDGVGTRSYLDVVDATQEVVGMVVDRTRRAACIGIRPASRDLEARRPNVQRGECGTRYSLNPGYQRS